jgi:hypothetical protein
METLRHHERLLDPVPGRVVRMLSALEHDAGAASAKRAQYREPLKALVTIARIQSTEASNAIEGIVAPAPRLRALMRETTTPENRFTHSKMAMDALPVWSPFCFCTRRATTSVATSALND